MIIHFNKIENIEIKRYLEENYAISNISENMLEIFQGSIGKAISLKDKKNEYTEIENIVENINKKNIIDILQMSEIIYKSKDEILEILDYINIILLKKAKENYKYTKCINIVENTKKRLKQNANYDMCIDNMLFNISEELS